MHLQPGSTAATSSCCSGSPTVGPGVLLADNYARRADAGALTDRGREQPWLPLHEHCLFKNGIHLGEMFYFTELARWLREHKRNRFLLHRAAAAPAGRGRLARDADRHRMKVAIVTGGSSGWATPPRVELAKRGWAGRDELCA